MSIKSVDMQRALVSESYAAQVVRSGLLDGEQRGELAAHWGSDKVLFWESVDSTQYRIDDEDWNIANDAGRKTAEERTGHDGSKQNWVRVAGDALVGAGSTVASYFPSTVGKGLHNLGNKIKAPVAKAAAKRTGGTTDGLGDKMSKKAGGGEANDKNLSDIATIIMTAASALQYRLDKPNEDQYHAAMELYDAKNGGGGLLEENQNDLANAQADMENAVEQTTELTDEAQEANEEANEQIDDDKTSFDFLRDQYDYIKDKAARGEKITKDDKAIIDKISPLMEKFAGNIDTTKEEISEDLEGKYGEIEEFQDDFDNSAETMANVQAVTDFAENFDSSTKTMAYIEGVAQGLNGASAGIAAGRLAAKSAGLGWFATAAFVATGVATSVSSAFASAEQFSWAGRIGDEIDVRENTQDLNSATEELYSENLDAYAGNMEIIDDMELVVPEDIEVPTESVEATDENGGSEDPFVQTRSGNNDNENENGSLENDPNYTRTMGKGSDYTDILTGDARRSKSDKMFTDKDGKVVLTKTYSDAIESVTGDKEGKGYSTEFIPRIIAKVLGEPFTEDVINKIRNGEKADNNVTGQIFAKLLGMDYTEYIQNIVNNGGNITHEHDVSIIKSKSGEEVGKEKQINTSKFGTTKAKNVINFYWPIFAQAASGWVNEEQYKAGLNK